MSHWETSKVTALTIVLYGK